MRSLFVAAVLSPLCLLAQYPPGTYPGGQYPGSTPPAQSPGQYPNTYPNTYPPNTYPPSTYPGPLGVPLSIPSIHLPSRKSKSDDSGNSTNSTRTTVESIDGSLRRLSEKDLSIQTASNKVLRFRLIAKTEFQGKDGRPVRDSLIHPGDKLTVEVSPDDIETALYVILDKAGNQAERDAASLPVDEARVSAPDPGDFGKARTVTEKTAGDPEPRETTTRETTPAETDRERPTLARSSDDTSRPADIKRSDDIKPSADAESTDDIIRDARSESYAFSDGLPNFLVTQVTTRYTGPRRGNDWRALDVVTADVASVNGQEEYRNIKVNGRPGDPEKSGSWSTGEFQVTLDDILSPRTFARFTLRGEQRVANRTAWVFDLSVEQPNSHWEIVSQRGGNYFPAYRGAIWVDKETRRVLRIEQRAIDLPRNFAYDNCVSTLVYGYVDIEGKSWLLPIQSENIGCLAGTNDCNRNVIEFRNYRKFSSDSSVKFDQ
ncbi:MAG TPA: hypothetical protein VHY84_10125 [Bryobacteraceae bacterium]|nr:hypothetical protein [Bryobacteraceae bacterium]